VTATITAMATAMVMAMATASAAAAAAMMTVATKKATRTKEARPRRGRCFVDHADERGDAHHGVASCLNIINDDVSINALFNFNTI
jgi:hypothetical protein